MKIIKHKNTFDFLKYTQNFLEEKEAENNLILATAFSLLKERKSENDKYIFLSVENLQKTVLCSIITYQKTLIISGINEFLDHSINLLVNYILNNNIEILMVRGLERQTKAFISYWYNKTKINYQLTVNQKIYRLDNLSKISYSNGYLRLSDSNDLDLISVWLYQFINETVRKINKEEADKLTKKRIENKTIYIWIDNNIPVTMAGKSRPTNNCIAVNAVYTPPNYRSKGYATSCVAKLSDILLKDYKFCTLLTDPTNSTPNKIYQEIGYYHLSDYAEYKIIK